MLNHFGPNCVCTGAGYDQNSLVTNLSLFKLRVLQIDLTLTLRSSLCKACDKQKLLAVSRTNSTSSSKSRIENDVETF